MMTFTGGSELRGTLINENTLEFSNGKIRSLDFPVNQSKIGKDVVIRSDAQGKPIITEMIYS